MLSEVPEAWKDALITATPKTLNPSSISLKPQPVKVVERVIRERLINHLNRHSSTTEGSFYYQAMNRFQIRIRSVNPWMTLVKAKEGSFRHRRVGWLHGWKSITNTSFIARQMRWINAVRGKTTSGTSWQVENPKMRCSAMTRALQSKSERSLIITIQILWRVPWELSRWKLWKPLPLPGCSALVTVLLPPESQLRYPLRCSLL